MNLELSTTSEYLASLMLRLLMSEFFSRLFLRFTTSISPVPSCEFNIHTSNPEIEGGR